MGSKNEKRKRSLYGKSRRFMAGFLALVMVASMLPAELFGAVGTAYAQEPEAVVEKETTEKAEAAVEKDTAKKAEAVDTETDTNGGDQTEASDEEGKSKVGTTSDEETTTDADTEITSMEPAEETASAVEEEVLDENDDLKNADKEDADVASTDETTVREQTVIEQDLKEVSNVHKLDNTCLATGISNTEVTSLDTNLDTNAYFKSAVKGGKPIKVKSVSSVAGSTTTVTYTGSSLEKTSIIFGMTGGGVGSLDTTEGAEPYIGIKFTTTADAEVNMGFFPKKAGGQIAYRQKNSDGYTNVTTEGISIISYEKDGDNVKKKIITASDTKAYTYYRCSFMLEGAGTYYVGFKSDGGIVTDMTVTEYDEASKISLSDATVDLGDAVTSAKYTGSAIKPTVSVTPKNETTAITTGYTVTYARKEGSSEPGDSDYKAEKDFDFVSVGTIYVKVTGSGKYKDSKVVNYTIEKTELDADKKTLTYPIDTAQAPTEGTNWEQSIDLNEQFGFTTDAGVIYGTPTLKNETAQNVLANTTVSIDGTNLKFTSRKTAESEVTDAVIEIPVSFTNYADTTLTVTITMVAKTELTIGGTPIADKEWDGEPAEYDATKVELSGADNIPADTELAFAWSKKDGTALDKAPTEIGSYILTVSIPDKNANYSGSQDFSFDITKKTLTLIASDRIYVKGYKNNPVETANNSLYFDYKELGEDLVNTKITDFLNNVDIKLTYQKADGTAVTVDDFASAEDNAEITIVPEMSIKVLEEGSTATVDEHALDNYTVETVNGKLTIRAEEEALAENVHELNFTKDDWHPNKETEGTKTPTFLRYGSGNKDTDGYFTVVVEAKATGTGNGYPLVVYDKYTQVAKVNTGRTIKFTTTKPNATVEVIAHLKSADSSKNVVDASLTVCGKEIKESTEGVEKLTGKVILPTQYNADATATIVKATVNLTEAKEYSITQTGEPQLYYVKVTEHEDAVDPKVSVTPTISAEDTAKLDGATVYFVAGTESKAVTSGTALELTQGTKYTLQVKKNDTVVSGITAKINDSSEYTAPTTATASVTITITSTGGQTPPGPGEETIKITPAISGSDLLNGGKVYFKAGEKEIPVDANTELELDKQTEYKLIVKDASGTVSSELVAKIDGKTTYTPPAEASSTPPTIVIEKANSEVKPPIQEDPAKPTKPTATPGTGHEFESTGGSVELKAETGAEIHYIKSESGAIADTPSAESPKYSEAILITKDTWIKAVAIKDGKTSDVLELTYTVLPEGALAKPGVTVPADSPVEKGTKVRLTAAAGADIHYTTDGTDPTTDSPKFTADTSDIEINADMTIKAIAAKDGKTSNVAEFKYTLKADKPVTPDPVDPDKPAKTETDIQIKGLKSSYEYTGGKIIPDITVWDCGTKDDEAVLLAPGIDYTVAYKNNVKVTVKGKEPEIVITGKGNYAGKTASVKFDIADAADSRVTDIISIKGAKIDKINKTNSVEYTGKAIYPDLKITIDKKAVTYVCPNQDGRYTIKDSDKINVIIAVSGNVNAGTATVLVTGAADAKSKKVTSAKASFKITPVDLSTAKNLAITADKTKYAVNGATTNVTVKHGDTTLKYGRDYTLKYANNKTVTKSALVTVVGKGNYAKSPKNPTKFEIEQLNMQDLRIDAVTACDKVKAGKVKAVITDLNGTVLKDSKYTLKISKKNGTEYTECKATDELKKDDEIKVTAVPNSKDKDKSLTGETPEAFFTVGEDFSKAKIAFTNKKKIYCYTGKAVKLDEGDLEVTIKGASGKLTRRSADSTEDGYAIVSYSNNIDKGSATAVLKGTGKYSGTKTVKFKITQKTMKLGTTTAN